MLKRWISRYLRARDRRNQPRPVVITPDQWRLYLNNQHYRERRSHLYGKVT